MPYCTNCGNKIEEEHRYCGTCGESLQTDNHPERTQTYDRWEGFLSPQSIEYVESIFNSDQAMDPEDSGYQFLSQDVAAAMVEFGTIEKLDGANLLEMVRERASGPQVMRDDTEMLTDEEMYQRLMVLGFFRIPGLYDKSIGTD